ncbi:tetratricopeptide repeat protein, partial [Shewanella sp. 0m-11]
MRLFIVLFSVLILFFPNMSYGEGLDYEQVLEELEKNISAPSQKSEKLIAQLIGEWNNLSREQKINVYIYQAVFLTYQGNYNASVVSLKNAEKLAPRDALQSKIHQSLSANYIALKQYSEALTLMEDSLQRIDKYDDIEIKLSSYVRLANLALVLNAYQDMREFAAKSAELSAKINDVRQHCFSLLMLAVVDLKENRSGEAQQGFLSSQIYCEEKKFPLIGLMSQKGLALVALQSEDYNRAKYLLEPVLKGYQEFNFQTEINHVNALLSQTYLSLGDASQAEEFANKVMSLSD